jgi:hypothetical protein
MNWSTALASSLRNMILGRRFFVSPSDSLAIIAANADCIPYFKSRGGLKACARYGLAQRSKYQRAGQTVPHHSLAHQHTAPHHTTAHQHTTPHHTTAHQHTALRHSSAHQHTTIHHNTPQLSALQHSTSTAQCSTAQHSTAQHSTSTAQHSTSTAQHSTAQHSTAQHSTAQHSTAVARASIYACIAPLQVHAHLVRAGQSGGAIQRRH